MILSKQQVSWVSSDEFAPLHRVVIAQYRSGMPVPVSWDGTRWLVQGTGKRDVAMTPGEFAERFYAWADLGDRCQDVFS